MSKPMGFEVRVGLLRLQRIAHERKASAEDVGLEGDDELVDAAINWIDDQLAADVKNQDKVTRSKEWVAAGRCSRCGDYDPQCICYTR